jgi:O-antigen ligase
LVATAAWALRSYWRRGKLLLGVAAIAVVAYFAVPDSAWERLGTIKQATQQDQGVTVNDEGSARQRLEIWKVARTIVAENPLTGVGMGAYPNAHYVYAQRPIFDPTALGYRDTHSTYLNLMAETGIPGLIIFLTILAVTVVDTERTRRTSKASQPRRALQLYYMELGLLAYLIAGIWGSYGGIVLTYLYLALMSVTTQLLKTPRAVPVQSRGLRFPPRAGRTAIQGARG